MKYEKQIKLIESGRQIGFRDFGDKIGRECGIQKKGLLYLVYICTHDFEYDAMDAGKSEYYTYEILDDAIDYIVSRGFPFGSFIPQKGNKLFDPDWFDYVSCGKYCSPN